MKTISKILIFALVVAMLCPFIISCVEKAPENTQTSAVTDKNSDPAGNTGNGSNTVTEAPTDTGTVTDGNVDENGYVLDDLAKYNLNYNNDKVTVLNWNSEKPEFFIEKTDGSKVNDAIWNRNNAIETRLGVELSFIEEKGNSSNIGNFVDKVQSASGDKTYDIIATYSRTAGTLSIRGLYADLNKIDNSYLNFNQAWWPTTLIDTVTIGDALYFVSGDASTNVLHFMYTIYFNKNLASTYTDITENFYDLVRNGKWTIQKMIDLASDRYEDLNNNGSGANFTSSDLEDAYGFCTIYYGADAFYTGSGLKLVTQDNTEMLVISDDYTSDKAGSLVSLLGPFLSGKDACVFMSGGNYRQPFVNGNALFCQERAYLASNYLTAGTNGEVTFKYGILPTPKYNERQENYITIVGNPFTLYGISSDCDSMQEMTAIIECWGSEGYRKTTPALFYETMQARYADAPDDAEMWNIIRTTACFDLGRLFSKDEMGYYISEEISKVACKNGNWEVVSKNIVNVMKIKLKTIVSSYAKIQEN